MWNWIEIFHVQREKENGFGFGFVFGFGFSTVSNGTRKSREDESYDVVERHLPIVTD